MIKQIGWSTEANLLHAISKKLESLIKKLGSSVQPTTTTTTII